MALSNSFALLFALVALLVLGESLNLRASGIGKAGIWIYKTKKTGRLEF